MTEGSEEYENDLVDGEKHHAHKVMKKLLIKKSTAAAAPQWRDNSSKKLNKRERRLTEDELELYNVPEAQEEQKIVV